MRGNHGRISCCGGSGHNAHELLKQRQKSHGSVQSTTSPHSITADAWEINVTRMERKRSPMSSSARRLAGNPWLNVAGNFLWKHTLLNIVSLVPLYIFALVGLSDTQDITRAALRAVCRLSHASSDTHLGRL